MNLSICFLFVGILCIGKCITESVSVVTRYGKILGSQIETSFNGRTGKVDRFLGIPYAESPTGYKRFRKPVPRGSFPQVFNATDFGPACPQDLFMMMGWVPGFPYVDEDCLSLNIFTPHRDHGNDNNNSDAVMIWIHGGAYVIGQSKMYSAENLTMVGDVIVVTMNYRVSSLGFLSTGSNKYPGNMGLWDQHLAIQWVHDNIADFGGDPGRVTIFGESAGGSSVVYQALYPGNKGLFQRVIAESGSPLCPWAYQSDPKKYARILANNLNCTDSNLDRAIDCVQRFDAMTIVNNSRVGSQMETVFRAEWVPSFDDDFVPRKQQELLISGVDMFQHLDYMVGVNNNDGAFLTLITIQPLMTMLNNRTYESGIPKQFFDSYYIPLFLTDYRGKSSELVRDMVKFLYTNWQNVSNDDLTRAKFLEFSGDYNFFVPMFKTLRTHAQVPVKSKSFLYEFALRPTFNSAPSWVVGASHGEELPFVFGFPELMADSMKYRGNVSFHEQSISTDMMIMWSNFAKSGNPNAPIQVPQSIHWPEYNLQTKQYLRIADKIVASSNLFGEREAFWLDIEPRIHELEKQQPVNIIG